MQMSVSQSVSQAYLFSQFTIIFYNSKSDEMKLMQFLKDFKPFNLSQHSCPLVLVLSTLRTWLKWQWRKWTRIKMEEFHILTFTQLFNRSSIQPYLKLISNNFLSPFFGYPVDTMIFRSLWWWKHLETVYQPVKQEKILWWKY